MPASSAPCEFTCCALALLLLLLLLCILMHVWGGRRAGEGCLSVQLQSTLVSKVISCVGQQPKTRRQRSRSRCETMRDSRKLFHPKIKKKKLPSRCIQFKWRLLRLGYLKGNSHFILYKKAKPERDQRVEMSATQKRLSRLASQTIVQSIQY